MNKTMNERFDERFNRMIHFHRGEVLIQDTAGHFPICKDEDGNFTTNQFDAIKYFIQSEIDLAVAKREKEITEEILKFINSGVRDPLSDTNWSIDLSDVRDFIENDLITNK